MDHRPLTPFGAEAGPDLAGSRDAVSRERLRELYVAEGLLVLRDQALTMQQQYDLCSAFGPLVDHAFENFYVSNTREDGVLGTRELLFHSDVPFLPIPYEGVSLHAVEVGDGTTSTRFASAFDAWTRLPDRLKQRVEGLKALQVRERAWSRRTRLTDLEPSDMCTVHPVVRRQPGTGRPYLFVNEDMTGCIVGLSEADSDALLEELFSYLYASDHIYEHQWRPGDLVVWDNLAVQHARKEVGAGTRTLQRVTIARLGYAQQYPADTMSEDLHNKTLLPN
jgi:taurine dioxygenase